MQTDYEILKACCRQLENFLPWGTEWFTVDKKLPQQMKKQHTCTEKVDEIRETEQLSVDS